jgi:hypothetical protein
MLEGRPGAPHERGGQLSRKYRSIPCDRFRQMLDDGADTPGRLSALVEIDHGEVLTTRSAHLTETAIGEGDEVKKGAVVGKLGSTGRSTRPAPALQGADRRRAC